MQVAHGDCVPACTIAVAQPRPPERPRSRVPSRSSLPLCVSLLAATVLAAEIVPATSIAAAATAPLAGRAIADVLGEALAQGIIVVFNTQVVPESLRVLAEPSAQSGVPRLEEVLAPHGLMLVQVGEGAYAVRPVPAVAAAPAASSRARPAEGRHVVLEEVIVLAYFIHRSQQIGWKPWHSVGSSALLRGAYHLYQGFGGFLGNIVMGLIFGTLYRRWGRVMPFLFAHFLIDSVAFIGYDLLAGKISWLP